MSNIKTFSFFNKPIDLLLPYCLFPFLFLSVPSAISQVRYEILENQSIQTLDKLEVFADSTFQMRVAEVAAQKDFTSITQKRFKLPEGKVYWIRFVLSNNTDAHIYRFLQINASDLYYTALYKKDGNQFVFLDKLSSKDSLSEKKKSFGNRYLFPIELEEKEEKVFYLFCDRRWLPVTLTLQLFPADEFTGLRTKAYQGGMFTGAGLVYFMASILLGFFIRKREFFFLVIYIASGVVYLFYSQQPGLANLFSNLGVAYLFDALPYIAPALGIIGYTGMFMAFFEVEKKGNFLPKLFKAVMCIEVLCIIALLFWPQLVRLHPLLYLWVIYLIAFCSMVAILGIGVLAFYVLKQDVHEEQKWLLLIFAPYFFLVVAIWLMESGALPRIDFIYDSVPGLLTFFESTILGGVLITRAIKERIMLKNALAQDRQEIIHDLHSGLLPEIDSLLELNKSASENIPPQVHKQIGQIGSELSEDIRSLMWTLTQKDGGTLGALVARLRQKVKTRFTLLPTQTKFTTNPVILPEGIQLPFSVSYHIYHFVKEAVNNSAKHANATHFECHIEYTSKGLDFRIHDNGCGFHLGAMNEANGYGLRELVSRAQKMGGFFDCDTSPGKGACISLHLPMSALNHKKSLSPPN